MCSACTYVHKPLLLESTYVCTLDMYVRGKCRFGVPFALYSCTMKPLKTEHPWDHRRSIASGRSYKIVYSKYGEQGTCTRPVLSGFRITEGSVLRVFTVHTCYASPNVHTYVHSYTIFNHDQQAGCPQDAVEPL